MRCTLCIMLLMSACVYAVDDNTNQSASCATTDESAVPSIKNALSWARNLSDMCTAHSLASEDPLSASNLAKLSACAALSASTRLSEYALESVSDNQSAFRNDKG